jgi:hypothetical protein
MDKVAMGLYGDYYGLLLSNVVHSATALYSYTYSLGDITLGSLVTKRVQLHPNQTITKVPNLFHCTQVCILFILLYYIIKICYYSYENIKYLN